MSMGVALSCAVDLSIAVILIYYLWKGSNGVDRYVFTTSDKIDRSLRFSSTKNVIHVLMAYCVNTGLLTTYGKSSWLVFYR